MALKKLLKDLSIISKLGTNPGVDDGLSEEQLKAKFDEAANIIKDYLNNYLILEIEKTVDVEALLSDILDVTLSKDGKAADAKVTGDELKKKMNSAGGTMSGVLNMGAKKIENLADPEYNADATNKAYVDSKHFTRTAELPASGWSDAVPFTQTVTVAGILGTDTPHWGAVYAEDAETALAQKEAYSVVDDLDTADDSVTFTCFEGKPEVDLTIQMEVNR